MALAAKPILLMPQTLEACIVADEFAAFLETLHEQLLAFWAPGHRTE